MSATRLARRWLEARQNDMANAKLALDIYESLQAYLKKDDPDFEFNLVEKAAVLSARLFGKGPLYARLHFMVGGKQVTFYNDLRQVIYVGSSLLFDPARWDLTAKMILSSPRFKSEILHELTHHIDSMRLKRGWDKALDQYKDPYQDELVYYNSPIEMNAYFQQGASPIVKEWQEILKDFTPDDPNEDAHAISIMNMDDMAQTPFSGFLADVLRPLPKKFWPALTPENKRRFQKRVYDLYDKTSGEAKRILQDLKRKRDPIYESLFNG